MAAVELAPFIGLLGCLFSPDSGSPRPAICVRCGGGGLQSSVKVPAPQRRPFFTHSGANGVR